MNRLENSFFERDALEVAPELLGKLLVRSYPSGLLKRFLITETEAYRGEEDLACHASKGKTSRTEIMYEPGGFVYVYLIYGIHWMLNFVTGKSEEPQAVLIRSLKEVCGPGRLTKLLEIDKSFYGEKLSTSNRLWLEDHNNYPKLETTARIGIDYAGEWKFKPWRFVANEI
jgi:DNA-3-methyladenine glycosylase